MNKKKLNIRLENNIYDSLNNLADSKNTTMQSIVKESLLNYIAKADDNTSEVESRFKFIDLFAGIGGMRLGFEEHGGNCVFSSEWDKYSQQTYFANHGDMPHGDITLIHEDEVPNHDILVAGFPCQPFSIAGVSKKNSLGRSHGFLDKTQGTLFFDVVRIINAKRPKAFLLENVKNLRSHDKGNTFRIIKETLESLDYEIFDAVLDGQAYVPQHRERIFIIGFDKRR